MPMTNGREGSLSLLIEMSVLLIVCNFSRSVSWSVSWSVSLTGRNTCCVVQNIPMVFIALKNWRNDDHVVLLSQLKAKE